jgi:hypothetical protein
MSTLTCIETYIDQDQNYYGSFIIEPLEAGQGITLEMRFVVLYYRI